MKSLITAVFLAGIASQALAGEDSTHRLHGVGPAWYEIEDGLRKLAAAGSDEPDSRPVALERVSASDAYLPEAADFTWTLFSTLSTPETPRAAATACVAFSGESTKPESCTWPR